MITTENKNKLIIFTGFILFLLFFLSFLNIKLWDYDFWWHIATGRYIVDQGEIPSQDVFSFVTEDNRELTKSTSLRESVWMRQYWLAQVIFYYSYILFGSWGIVIIRSLLLTAALWLCYKGLRKFDAPELFSLSLLIPVFYVLLQMYTGERPVLFSFVFVILVFLIIEDFIKSRGKGIYLLPLIMLIWSNLHGGFVIGLGIIGVYLIIEVFKFILKKSELPTAQFTIFITVMILSFVLSFLNPNGWSIIPVLFQSKYKIFEEGIQEYKPLFYFYSKKTSKNDYALFFVVIITAITLILRFMKMMLSHLVLLSGIFIMGLMHQRYFVFAATLGIIIVGKENAELFKKKFKSIQYTKLQPIAVCLLWVVIFIFTIKTTVSLAQSFKNLSKDHATVAAKGAVDFIEKNQVPGRMFNTDAVGGYAIWRLYPWKKIFTDTRTINIAPVVEHKFIIAADSQKVGEKYVWERLLEMYDINFVVINPLDYYGGLKPLIKAINENERWVLVYRDGEYFVFLRNYKMNMDLINRFRLTKEDAYWSIIASTSFKALNNPNNPFFFNTIGECFMNLKNYDEAEKAFMHVLRIEPNNTEANNALTEILNIKQSKNKKG